ncbi:hypothetical protein [Rhodophyticola sp.]|jgi:hypothetical protein|uniref:hypothetical protein n=1 Tax=Rhodophyticola sp. TaxID=2680032 RepID=UPI003D2D0600
MNSTAQHLPLAMQALRAWAAGAPLILDVSPGEREAMARLRIETAFEDPAAPSPFQSLYRIVFARQRAAAEAVRADLARLSTPSRFYKGAAIVQDVLGGEPFSLMRDVDLVVPSDRASLARAVLRHHGFRQADFDTAERALRSYDPLKVAAYEDDSYELYAFSRIERFPLPELLAGCPELWQRAPIWLDGDEVLLLVTLDVHLRAAQDIPAEHLWSGPEDRPFVDPSVEAWLLATRYYLDIARQRPRPVLRDLFYLARLFPQAEIDRCVALATRHDSLPAMFYTYEFLRRLGMPGAALPETVLTDGNRRNDFGWQYGRLWGGVDGAPSLAA